VSRRYTFSKWLVKQNERQDNVGEFARFVMSDDDAPIGAFRERAWNRYLVRVDAPPRVREGVVSAFNEFASHKEQP
jgi:hypothetical protein